VILSGAVGWGVWFMGGGVGGLGGGEPKVGVCGVVWVCRGGVWGVVGRVCLSGGSLGGGSGVFCSWWGVWVFFFWIQEPNTERSSKEFQRPP